MESSETDRATEHGRAFDGPARRPQCKCGGETRRDERYDAYYCVTSGIWLELACSDPECPFCPGRPEAKEVEG